MKTTYLLFGLIVLAACQSPAGVVTQAAGADSCGAAQYQNLVGGPSRAATSLDIPGSSRHYGRTEPTATNDPSRLNFVHSGTAFESVTDPNSTIIRVFCG